MVYMDYHFNRTTALKMSGHKFISLENSLFLITRIPNAFFVAYVINEFLLVSQIISITAHFFQFVSLNLNTTFL